MLDMLSKEYLERIEALLPDGSVGPRKILVNLKNIDHATIMSQLISNALLELIENFSKTDLVLEIEDAIKDIWVLSKYLEVSFETCVEEKYVNKRKRYTDVEE